MGFFFANSLISYLWTAVYISIKNSSSFIFYLNYLIYSYNFYYYVLSLMSD